MKFAVLAAVSLVALSDRPLPVADEYRALSDEYRTAVRQSDATFEKARTDEERQKIHADFQKLHSRFVGRYLAFAEKHPGDREALLALFFVLHLDTRAEPRHVDKAVELILKDHIKSDRLTDPPILQLLDDSPAAEKLLRGVLEKSPHHAIQAQACLSLAQFIKERANACPPEQAARLTREAEELFAQVVNRYADVKEVAEKARGELFEIRHLVVGKTLPDVKGKDSDNREFKLSDYRGKVVVLTFWAEWCPPCMKMVPHEDTPR